MSATRLQRVAFETSRLAEFCSQKELVAQTGAEVVDWPLVVLKELVDNALDASEEAEVAPEIDIQVSTETRKITIADLGPGMPAATVERILNYAVRVSSREAYVSPTRGRQGNAMKTILAMAFALNGARGITVIEAHGIAHKIVFEMDRVRREPMVLREISESIVKKGTRITVQWPDSARSVLRDAEDRFLQMIGNFSVFNPHAWFSCDWDGVRSLNLPATNPSFRKWRASDPTSAHWYHTEAFSRYMAAHIARDEDQGRVGRTVHEFISEFRGLTGTAKRKVVMAEANALGWGLANFFKKRSDDIPRLLEACQRHSKPPYPRDLGIIGADHLRRSCDLLGGDPETFNYRKHVDVTAGGLPYVVEVAFAYCPDGDDRSTIISGVNFSSGARNPFQRIGYYESLSALLERQMAGPEEPIIFMIHYVCPRVDDLDRGKSAIGLPYFVAKKICELVESVTKAWRRQRKVEERDASRELARHDRLAKTERATTIKDAASEIMEAAYNKVSDGGRLPALARQIMYAARPHILKVTGKKELNDKYFTQTLPPDYVNEYPERCADWDVVWDARGTFTEPHTGREVPLGTLEVRQYLGARPPFTGVASNFLFKDHFPTDGPRNRYDTIFYIEKEGFEPLLKAAHIARRFDIGTMSTKGMSVTAARLLLDQLCKTGLVKRVFVLHDFDTTGFSIHGTLGKSNRRYQFEKDPPLVDIGLRLSDVREMDLQSEPVIVEGDWQKRAATLRRHGATDAEVDFLQKRRVEINAMTSPQIIDFIERKFAEHGVAKIIPDDNTIEQQYRRVMHHKLMEEAIKAAEKTITEQLQTTAAPEDLRQQLADKLTMRPTLSWDMAIAAIARDKR
jgi:DNA topoisomerase VI subunit B